MTTIPLQASPRRSRAQQLEAALARPAVWLWLIVSSSIVVRLAAAWRHTSPRTFPDEYIYPTIARSLGAGDGLTVRGTPAHFPALLEPLLTWPIWLVNDTETAYRLTQAFHVVAMSLAAIPIYWLARRVGSPAWQAVCCGAFTIAVPSLLFSSYMTADALAYPLALGALALGVATLDRPTRANQIGFVALAGLAAFARMQYIVIPVAFVLALLLLERRHVVGAARRNLLALGLFAAPAVLGLAAGPGRLLGYYHGILAFDLSPAALAHWAAVDAMLLAYACGIAIVPGAIAGLALGLAGRAPRPQRALAALVSSFVALLLIEAALYAANGSARFQERYLITIGPLLVVAFSAGLSRLPQGRRIAAVVAVVLFVLSVRIPLIGYSVLDGKQDSPFLWAVARLEQALPLGGGSLAVAIATAVLAGIALATAFRPRIFAPIAFGATLLAMAAASFGATSLDVAASTRMETTYSANGTWTWIDDLHVGPTSVLLTPGTARPSAEAHLFWNRDLTRVLRMPGAPMVDVFGHESTGIDRRGRLKADGATVHGPVLVEETFALARLDDARRVRSTPGATLWLPHSEARMAMLTVGRYIDGWIDPNANVFVWPRESQAREGVVELELSLPEGVSAAVVKISTKGFVRRLTVRPGVSSLVRVPVRAVSGPVAIKVGGRPLFVDNGHAVVARLAPPRFVPLPK